MKIALITTDFLPNIGGIAQHVVELAKALIKGGDDVEVITPYYTSKWRDFRKQPFAESLLGIPIWRIPFVLDTSIRFVSGQLSSRISDRRFRRELLQRLHELKPNIAHWHALESRLQPLKTWTRSAKVWTNHTTIFLADVAAGRKTRYAREAEQADEIIAPSEELCDVIASLGVVPRERIHFIPNGVDSKRFNPNVDTSGWRQRLRLSDDEQLVLCPRRLERKNGVRYFIEAATQILREGARKVRFVVAGDASGPKSESDEDLIRRLVSESNFSSHFELLGRVENKDLPGLYACSAVVVIPSLLEATSLSASEAMAARKPVVCTDVGGLPFLIRDRQNGLLVPPRNPDRLAHAIKELLGSENLRMQFGESGRARVERELGWELVARQAREIYLLAIQRRRSNQTAKHSESGGQG
jgi:glycosyltransferase involved in cell wall biosynthesis